jgi:hypothetical protein
VLFFIFNPFEKHFSQIDHEKTYFIFGPGQGLGGTLRELQGAILVSALGELQGVRSLGALRVHVD